MKYSYLALGDSYTIGEGVTETDSFPSQTVRLLNTATEGFNSTPFSTKRQQGFDNPLVIAKTGWTTDELDKAIDTSVLVKTFDMVSLLIGVNNQYRNRSLKEFAIEFEHLVQRAIQFAGNIPAHVFVLSIPDWGITPFAGGRDRTKIAAEINAFNHTCEATAIKFHTNYIDITTAQRETGTDPEFLAGDGLHPSGKEYSIWAIHLADAVKKILNNEYN